MRSGLPPCVCASFVVPRVQATRISCGCSTCSGVLSPAIHTNATAIAGGAIGRGKKKPLRKTPVAQHPLWGCVPLRGGILLSDSYERHTQYEHRTEGQSKCQAKKKPLERGARLSPWRRHENSLQYSVYPDHGVTKISQRGRSLSNAQRMCFSLTCLSFKYATPCNRSSTNDSSKSGLRLA